MPVTQAIRWTATLNNYTEEEEQQLNAEGISLAVCRYLMVGKEVGDSGTPHLQIYLELIRKKTLRGVKRALPCLERAHLEVAQADVKKNREYCSKEGDWKEYGTFKTAGFRSDLEVVKKDIDDGMSLETMIDEHFSLWVRYGKQLEKYWQRKNGKTQYNMPEVYVFYGKSGTGKTRKAWEFNPESTWTYPGFNWFDGYEGQEVAIFDEFDGSDLSFAFWKQITDGYPIQVRVKGGHTKWQPKIIVFTSNIPPGEWFEKESKPMGWLDQLTRRIKEIKLFE